MAFGGSGPWGVVEMPASSECYWQVTRGQTPLRVPLTKRGSESALKRLAGGHSAVKGSQRGFEFSENERLSSSTARGRRGAAAAGARQTSRCASAVRG